MHNQSRPYVLAESTWASVEASAGELAVVPWGAVEPHNYHLPYGTDIYLTEYLAAESARAAWDRGARVRVLPIVPFGVNTGQLDLRFTINMNPSTQLAVLADAAASLANQGISKLVIFNGHGGNDFHQMVRELQPRHPTLFLCCINWYEIVDPTSYVKPGDHAGELETALMLHIAPQLVRPLSEAGEGTARPFKISGLRERWAWAPRAWREITADTGVGNPRGATAEKGQAYANAVIQKVAAFFTELGAADIHDLYG